MLPRSRQFTRLAAALIIALLFAVPATALFVRMTVHFAASFDVPSSPNSGLVADVGQISVVAPATEFIVVPGQDGGGELKVSDGGTVTQATLNGTFKTPFTGHDLTTTWVMGASQTNSPFTVRFVDDSDSGMIDSSFGGDGMIVVGGQQVMPYQPDTPYSVALSLTDPVFGPSLWSVMVTSLDGSAQVGLATGVLPNAGQLKVTAVKLVRPSGASAGQFFVDDLKAVSSSTGFTFK